MTREGLYGWRRLTVVGTRGAIVLAGMRGERKCRMRRVLERRKTWLKKRAFLVLHKKSCF